MKTQRHKIDIRINGEDVNNGAISLDGQPMRGVERVEFVADASNEDAKITITMRAEVVIDADAQVATIIHGVKYKLERV